MYFGLFVNLVISHFGFENRICLLIAPVPVHFFLVTFLMLSVSTLYTTLPHNLIKENLDLIERTFNKKEGKLYLACNDRKAFFHF